MKEISFDESRKIQLEILQVIDEFCRENSINYSLAWGTLIGAIRHKGFIPWDDDIDLMMKRTDYERFIDSFNSPNYRLYCFKKREFWHQFLAKITDERTMVVFNYKNKGSFGLWISIFPIDNVPDVGFDKWKKKLFRRTSLFRLRTASWRKDTSLLRNVLKVSIRFMLSFVSSYKCGKFVENLLTENNDRKTERVCIWAGSRGITGFDYYPSFLFENYMKTEFEGKQYMIISEYDQYLRMTYGDYLQLPPEKERIPSHDYKAYYIDK